VRLLDAARVTGADVPVCLDLRPRIMRGTGEHLSEPLDLPPLPAVLVNPGVAVSTKAVFAAWQPELTHIPPSDAAGHVTGREQVIDFLNTQVNDLEPPAIALAPDIAAVIAALRAVPACRLARMSGSGATCFGLFLAAAAAIEAAGRISAEHPAWWVRACALGGGRGQHSGA
jgi:4-diphosphocytidyl-2-C-methyl-D-erythritol kinase